MTATRTHLCLGIDPDARALPDGFTTDVAGVEAFARLVLDAAGSAASAVKVNLAFFEAWGSEGLAALERLRARIPADLPFIADAKRGDIGSTGEQHARALFDHLAADAVTVSPYLGRDAVGPFLERSDRFVYLLCRTSNPNAADLQSLVVSADAATGVPAEPLALRVARLAGAWQHHDGTVGLVVGATAPEGLDAVRRTAPGLPFLAPGVGAQGGDESAVMRAGPATEAPGSEVAGGGLLVNVSRGIAGAARGATDPGEAMSAAAQEWAARLRVLR
jgi:orotidine-5'-phosphate decarboxylase